MYDFYSKFTIFYTQQVIVTWLFVWQPMINEVLLQ